MVSIVLGNVEKTSSATLPENSQPAWGTTPAIESGTRPGGGDSSAIASRVSPADPGYQPGGRYLLRTRMRPSPDSIEEKSSRVYITTLEGTG